MAKAKKTKPAAKPASQAGQTVITKAKAIEYLRKVEKQIYSTKTEKEVQKLALTKQIEFFGARLAFTKLIAKLNATLMAEMAKDLQAQARELQKGIDKMSGSLTKLENAVQWAKTINGITASIGKVVKIFA